MKRLQGIAVAALASLGVASGAAGTPVQLDPPNNAEIGYWDRLWFTGTWEGPTGYILGAPCGYAGSPRWTVDVEGWGTGPWGSPSTYLYFPQPLPFLDGIVGYEDKLLQRPGIYKWRLGVSVYTPGFTPDTLLCNGEVKTDWWYFAIADRPPDPQPAPVAPAAVAPVAPPAAAKRPATQTCPAERAVLAARQAAVNRALRRWRKAPTPRAKRAAKRAVVRAVARRTAAYKQLWACQRQG